MSPRTARVYVEAGAPCKGEVLASHANRGPPRSRRAPWTPPGPHGTEPCRPGRSLMARFRSNKRAKELQRKAKHEAKEARKRERQEKSQSGEADDDRDWSQAVGVTPPPGTVPEPDKDDEDDSLEEDAEEVEK